MDAFDAAEDRQLDRLSGRLQQASSWLARSSQGTAAASQSSYLGPGHKSRITTLQATMTRSLLRIQYYSLTPMVLFTIVVMPTLEPVFAIQFAALRVLQRFCANNEKRRFLNTHLHSAAASQKGPLSRAQQLYADAVFRPAVLFVLQNSATDRSWEHPT